MYRSNASKGRKIPNSFIKGRSYYEPNFKLRDLYKHTSVKDLWNSLTASFGDMMRPLDVNVYGEQFHFLLHLEQLSREIQAFNIPEQPVRFNRTHDELFSFEWPFEEDQTGKINVFYNDKVILDGKHQGYVHKIEGSLISAHFNMAVLSGMKTNKIYHVRIIPNTSTFKRCHDAIQRAIEKNIHISISDLNVNYDPIEKSTVKKLKKLQFFNKELNEEQQDAIRCMLSPFSQCQCLHPFVLFGPPGTGKTVTIVEAIEQAYITSKCSKILACAPSNAAADLICSKLIATKRYTITNLGRIYAHSRVWETVPVDIRPYSLMLSGSDESNGGPRSSSTIVNDADLTRRILVTTFVCSHQLRMSDGRPILFSHIFLDECAQASEPEALIPIVCSQNYGEKGDTSGVIALAGDPYQLGPVLMSNEAHKLGLGKSLLERLFTCRQCNLNKNHFSRIKQLCKTYRFKHPELIEIPSRLFYSNSLVVKNADEKWSRVPLEFFNVNDCICKREQFSFCNETEALFVCREVMKLKNEGLSIGVITPYRAQVRKIRSLLREMGEEKVQCKIGSVEEFQGYECDVVLISTVRTIPCSNFDFISNPKRFNVALTRARRKIVLFGCQDALVSSQNWFKFIEYVKSLSNVS